MEKLNIISPDDNKFSSEARGMLVTMLNNPEDDYCTIDEIYITFNADTKETINSTLKELITTGYVIQLESVFAVNKLRIPQMKII